LADKSEAEASEIPDYNRKAEQLDIEKSITRVRVFSDSNQESTDHADLKYMGNDEAKGTVEGTKLDPPDQPEKIVISELTKRLQRVRKEVASEIEEDLKLEMTYPILTEERKNRDHQNIIDARKFRLIRDENTKTDSKGVIFRTQTTIRIIEEEYVIQAATTIIDGSRRREVEHETQMSPVNSEEFEKHWAEKWMPVDTEPGDFKQEQSLQRVLSPDQSEEVQDLQKKSVPEGRATQSPVALPVVLHGNEYSETPVNQVPTNIRHLSRSVQDENRHLDTSETNVEKESGNYNQEQTLPKVLSPDQSEDNSEKVQDLQKKPPLDESEKESPVAAPMVLRGNEYSETPVKPVSEDIRRLSRSVRDEYRQSEASEHIYENIDDLQSIGSGDYSHERMEKFTDDTNDGFESSEHSRMVLPLRSEKKRKRDHESIIEDRTFSQELIEHTLVDANGVKFVFFSNTRCIHDMVVVSGKTVITDGASEETEDHPVKMAVITDRAMIPMSNKNLKDFDKIWNANWIPANDELHSEYMPGEGLSASNILTESNGF